MENRPFDPEDQDDLDSQASSKKKRSSTFSKFLSSLQRKDSEKLDDSEGEKPKRFRRMFARLFPSVVENPNQEQPSEQEHPMDYEAWFSWRGREHQATTPVTSEEQPENHIDSPRADEQTRAEENSPEGNNQEISQDLPEVTHESNKVPTEVEQASREPEHHEQLRSMAAEMPVSNPWEQEVRIRQQVQTEAEPKPETTQAAERIEKETVVERGPGMVLPVALVGLEYLSRKKADKKLEGRVNEEITTTNKEVDRNATLQREIEAVVKQNREQLEALKRARQEGAPETRQITQPGVERVRPRPEQRVAEAPKKDPEMAPAVSVRETVHTSPEKQPPIEEVKPQRILEQVADAAEHNVAVERVFERSHEVKDDQSLPGAATPIGTVMATQASTAHYHTGRSAHAGRSQQDGLLPFVADKADAASYKQAMAAGFWAAIMIIILGSIAYLVIK